MMLSIAYDIVLLLTCFYLWRDGGQTGRWGVILFLGATVMTVLAALIGTKFNKVAPMLFLADFALFIGFVILALRSNRRWPIWVSAMQLNCVSAHIVVLLAPVVVSRVYYAMETVWGLPMLIAMAAGTALDRRYDRQFGRAFGRR